MTAPILVAELADECWEVGRSCVLIERVGTV